MGLKKGACGIIGAFQGKRVEIKWSYTGAVKGF
jgi:hypothetical protein